MAKAGIVLLCDVPTDLPAYERKLAAAKKGKAPIANLQRAVVAEQVREIRYGDVVVEVDGEPVCFRDPALWRDLGVPDAKSAVVALLGSDGDIADVFNTLMEAGGLAGENELEAVDPTGA